MWQSLIVDLTTGNRSVSWEQIHKSVYNPRNRGILVTTLYPTLLMFQAILFCQDFNVLKLAREQ